MNPDLESRVTNLESDVKDLKKEVACFGTDLAELRMEVWAVRKISLEMDEKLDELLRASSGTKR